MSLIAFLKEFGEAAEDIKKERERQEATIKAARRKTRRR